MIIFCSFPPELQQPLRYYTTGKKHTIPIHLNHVIFRCQRCYYDERTLKFHHHAKSYFSESGISTETRSSALQCDE